MAHPLFEVRVAGVVPDTDLKDLRAISLPQDQVNTVLYGIDDQAALYGLLARLRSLGLEVVEVRKVSDRSLVEASYEDVSPETADTADVAGEEIP
jgi:hypothetical protein